MIKKETSKEAFLEAVENILFRNESFAREVCREYAHIRRREAPRLDEIKVADEDLAGGTLPAMPEE